VGAIACSKCLTSVASIFMWFLAGLIWIAFIVGIFWSYRNKKAKRDAARERKFQQLFSATAVSPGAGAAVAVAQFSRKSRLLDPQTTLLYYLLRSGLPDHEIFIDVPIGNLIEAPAQNYEAGQKMKRLAAARADFVVCNKQMEIIAVVLLNGGGQTILVEECLNSADVRSVRIDPAAAPKHTQVRALIYGET